MSKPIRDSVELDISRALGFHDLDAYTDGVMDTLDTVVEWADDEDDDQEES